MKEATTKVILKNQEEDGIISNESNINSLEAQEVSETYFENSDLKIFDDNEGIIVMHYNQSDLMI